METIIYEKKNNIRILTLNRPHRANALNQQMDEEMGEAVMDFTNDPDARVLIVTGAGEKHFSAGMDLKEIGERQAAGLPPRDITHKLSISNWRFRYLEADYSCYQRRCSWRRA